MVVTPILYTLPNLYILKNNAQLDKNYFYFVFLLGIFGYYIFRSSINQKVLARKYNGSCIIWGSAANFIRTNYIGSDHELHGAVLLCSGYWGCVRHANYVGEFLLAMAISMTCAEGSLLPYSLVLFKLMMILNKMRNSERRSKLKYGKYWDLYCKWVPYKLIPVVY